MHFLRICNPYQFLSRLFHTIFFQDSPIPYSLIEKPTLMALFFLHERDKFHENLKPSNILIDSNGSIKISEFGISNSSSKYVKGKDSVLYWFALERDPLEFNNNKATADDIWNFGICTLELFHGDPPLTSLPKSEALLEQNKERIGLLDGYENYITNLKRLSDEFHGIVMSCLRTEPIL